MPFHRGSVQTGDVPSACTSARGRYVPDLHSLPFVFGLVSGALKPVNQGRMEPSRGYKGFEMHLEVRSKAHERIGKCARSLGIPLARVQEKGTSPICKRCGPVGLVKRVSRQSEPVHTSSLFITYMKEVWSTQFYFYEIK